MENALGPAPLETKVVNEFVYSDSPLSETSALRWHERTTAWGGDYHLKR